MENKIDFKQLTNAELNIKLKGCEERYNNLKEQVVEGIKELERLNNTYIECKKVLDERLTKRTNNFVKDEDEELWLKFQ